jgi:hypothetical protein
MADRAVNNFNLSLLSILTYFESKENPKFKRWFSLAPIAELPAQTNFSCQILNKSKSP